MVLDGVARKVSLIILILSAIAWVVFVIGFQWLQSNSIEIDIEDDVPTIPDVPTIITLSRSSFRHTHISQFGGDGDDSGYTLDTETRQRLPFIMFAGGPILYIIMFINLLVGHPCSGSCAYFFTAAFIAAGGAALYFDGTIIYFVHELLNSVPGNYEITDFKVGRYLLLEFCGCFVAVLLMAVHMTMWACFTNPWEEPRRRGYTLHYDDDTPPVTTTYAPAGPTYAPAGPTYAPAGPTYAPAGPTYAPAGPTVVQHATMEPMASYPPPPMVHPVPPPAYTNATTAEAGTQ